jgi:hypothetical protein
VAKAVLPAALYRRSVERGVAVARHVFDWSRGDGGHEAFRRNFPAYTPPAGPGLWVPTQPAFQAALQPFWGANRPFVVGGLESCAPSPPPAYSETPGSTFYEEAAGCYTVTNTLSDEQRAIARF